jgi:uncharacterized membrane protein
MNKCHKWLQEEIQTWRAENIISGEQARQLSLRYAADSQDSSWGKIFLSAVGAIIFGLGVILLFAYNWQGMHRFTKLGAIFIALLLAHSAAWIVRTQKEPQPRLGESLHLLGTMLFGAGIWLVAQIYHIDEHYPNGILVWSLGALTLAWALPSTIHGLLALFLISLWSGYEVFDFDNVNHWGFWLVTLALVPLAWLQRSHMLLFFSLAATMLLYAFTIANINADIIIIGLFALACAQLLIARIAPLLGFASSAEILRAIGYIVYLPILYVITFENLGGEFTLKNLKTATEWLYWLLPLLLTGGALGVLLSRYRHMLHEPLERAETAATLLALIVFTLLSLGVVKFHYWNWFLMNAVFLAHGVIFMMRGLQWLRWKQVALGTVMVNAVIIARFLDLFDSLLMRSLVFLVVGASLFYVGRLYSKQKQERRQHA